MSCCSSTPTQPRRARTSPATPQRECVTLLTYSFLPFFSSHQHLNWHLCFFSRKNKAEATSGGFISDTLQRKLKDLEQENLSLRSEVTLAIKHKQMLNVGMQLLLLFFFLKYCAALCFQANHLKSETETYEEKEQQLVNDCVKELSESNYHWSMVVCDVTKLP